MTRQGFVALLALARSGEPRAASCPGGRPPEQMGTLEPGLQPDPTFQVWPRSCPLLSSRKSPYPGAHHSADCCGQAAWGMRHGRSPVPYPQKEAQLKPASPVLVPAGHAPSCHGPASIPAHGWRQREHLSLCPALSLLPLQLAPQVEHTARRPGQLLSQRVVGLLHVLQLFPQKCVHLGEAGAPGRAGTTVGAWARGSA